MFCETRVSRARRRIYTLALFSPLFGSHPFFTWIRDTPGVAAALHSEEQSLHIWNLSVILCVLGAEHPERACIRLRNEGEREKYIYIKERRGRAYAEIGWYASGNPRIDVLWMFISSRERPRDAVASALLKWRAREGQKIDYFYRFDWWNFQEAIIDFTPLVPRAPPLFHSPRLARPSRAVPPHRSPVLSTQNND